MNPSPSIDYPNSATVAQSSYPFVAEPEGYARIRFSPALHALFLLLHQNGIIAIEWGLGLNSSLGVPEVVFHHHIVIPTLQLEAALTLITSKFQRRLKPSPQPLGVLETIAAQVYTIPDLNFFDGACPNADLYIYDTATVPLDLAHVSFIPDLGLCQPDAIEAFQSYLYLMCRRKGRPHVTHMGPVAMWLAELVVYIICGVRYIPKCEIEGQVSDDPQWERDGLARLDKADWGGRRWLAPVLRPFVKGEVIYDDLTIDWWESRAPSHL